MDFTPHTGAIEKKRTHCLIVGSYDNHKLTPAAEIIDQESNGLLSKILRREGFKANPGDTLLLHQLSGCRADKVLVVGLGKKKELIGIRFVKALERAVKAVASTRSKQVLCALLDAQVEGFDLRWKARQTALRFATGCYRFTEMKSEPGEVPELSSVEIHASSKQESSEIETGARQGKAIASGMKSAKDLANLPGNVCTPTYLAEQALELADRHSKLKVTILEERDMEKLGMGALLSVSRGSRQPAKLIVLEYQGGKPKAKPIVLVGKGLTFDAGGI